MKQVFSLNARFKRLLFGQKLLEQIHAFRCLNARFKRLLFGQ